MKSLSFSTIFLTLILFTGCGTLIPTKVKPYFGSGSNDTLSVISNPKYMEKDLSEKRFVFLPVTEDIMNIQNRAEFSDDFGGDSLAAEAMAKVFVNKSILAMASKALNGMKLTDTASCARLRLTQKDTSSFIVITKKFDNDSVSHYFYVPKKEILAAKNIKPDIILMINRIQVCQKQDTVIHYASMGNSFGTPYGGIPAPGYTSTDELAHLESKVDFIIYDYSDNDVITCCSAKNKREFAGFLKKRHWTDLFEIISRTIFASLPVNSTSTK